MLIYQVLDANNRSVGEYSNLDFALQNAQDLTYWHTGHYYHVEEIEIGDFPKASKPNQRIQHPTQSLS